MLLIRILMVIKRSLIKQSALKGYGTNNGTKNGELVILSVL